MMNIWQMYKNAVKRIYDLRFTIIELHSIYDLRHIVFRFLFFVFCFSLTACASVDPVVKIGLVGPFEGAERAIGYDVIYSARLAVREINAAGGIDGYRVSLVALDDSGDVELARETAVSLTLDPSVVAVVGHWVPDTTNVVQPIYADAGLPLLAGGIEPFGASELVPNPSQFREKYESVTPFNEAPGPYAAPAYDAFQLLREALEIAGDNGNLNRGSVAEALSGLEIDGLTGTIYQQ
jgi:ABC-type branched-subunit amino acid transport system substrate-binding protein